jgi:WD40 repeat protein
VAAWWELPESARYLREHLIEHLLAADRTAEGESVATDLRWVQSRLDEAGPVAAVADLRHTGRVTAVAIAPDGTWLTADSDDGTVWIWDPATGQQRIELTGHTGWVSEVAIAPDGTWLATTSGDGTLRVLGPAHRPAMHRTDRPRSSASVRRSTSPSRQPAWWAKSSRSRSGRHRR